MYKVFLAGPVTYDDNPNRWREDFIQSNNLQVLEFENPMDVEATGEVMIEEQLHRLKQCDAVLARIKDGVPTYGTPMEMVYAQAYDIPVVVWFDGEDPPAPITYHSNAIVNSASEAQNVLIELL
jgi:nucleoside 2-deoxyribosyltransferase